MAGSASIALLTDSGTNVPAEICASAGILCASLRINYPRDQYRDGVDITAGEIQARFAQEVPHTSTPSPQDIENLVQEALNEGRDHLLCVLTSSGLTSTFTVFESIMATHPEITAHLIDTKSIGAGAGINVCYASELIAQNTPWEQLIEKVQQAVDRSRVFFLVDTLDNLYRGGRINKAIYSLGSVLNLKPIITCGATGAYEVAGKARGRMKAIRKEIELVHEVISQSKRYRIGFATCACTDRERILDKMRTAFPAAERFDDFGEISAALSVHTGPGMVGITVQPLA
ncbi:MAG: DegV family protein [Eggerthellaceae bacterium]|jgi:DegV family protein with EDD domain